MALDARGTRSTWQVGATIIHGTTHDAEHASAATLPHARMHDTGRARPMTISATHSTAGASSALFGVMAGQKMMARQTGGEGARIARRGEETGELVGLQGGGGLWRPPVQNFRRIRESIYGRASDEEQ